MNEVKCPDCGFPMHKSGTAWSGKHRVQRYKCQKCGRTTIKHPDDKSPYWDRDKKTEIREDK